MDAELVPSERPASKAGPKRGKRKGNDGPVVEFDPEARAEYVTGFAKRKAQRRQVKRQFSCSFMMSGRGA